MFYRHVGYDTYDTDERPMRSDSILRRHREYPCGFKGCDQRLTVSPLPETSAVANGLLQDDCAIDPVVP